MIDDRNAGGTQRARSAAAMPWRSRTSSNPMGARANGNSKQGRRIRDLYRGMLERIDAAPDLLVKAEILAAAELKVAAENARSRLLAGDVAGLDQVIRLERLAASTERGLRKYATPAKRITLAEHLARRKEGAGRGMAA